MNTPNKLTLLRIILIPFFVLFLLMPQLPHNYLWALVIFGIASFTDYLDGHLARKYQLVTNFGKLMDPLADKLLVNSALICFVKLDYTLAVVVIIILAREFLVTSLRLVAAGDGVVIAADRWGKCKTVSQIIWVCYVMFMAWISENLFSGSLSPAVMTGLAWVNILLTAVAVGFTLFSGFNYIWNNRQCFKG